MDQHIIDKTYHSCDAFKQQSRYQRLKSLKNILLTDEQLLELTTQFKKAKERYEEAKQYGKYHPNLLEYQKAFQTCKITMMSHPVIKEYKELENALQRQLDQLSIDLANSVSSHIKHPKEYRLIK